MDITFDASDHIEIPTQIQSPRQMEEGGYSLGGPQGLFCQLMHSPQELLQLPMGKTVLYGKLQHFHIRIFSVQQATKLLGKTVGRLGSCMFCTPTVIRFFPPLKEIQQRLSN